MEKGKVEVEVEGVYDQVASNDRVDEDSLPKTVPLGLSFGW